MALEEYKRKRKFNETPEPEGALKKGRGPLTFVVQMHRASRLHYDFRLEWDGVLKSWAVPKGPSVNPHDQRLAVHVEDHPMDYGDFEGVIPKGNYGAGTVMVWDRGTFVERGSQTREESERALRKGYQAGHITFVMDGEKLKGEFALVKLKRGEDNAWLLLKKRDFAASTRDVTKLDRSVKTGRSMAEIAAEAPAKGEVWLPKREQEENPKKSWKPKPSEAPARIPAPKKEKLPRRVKPMIAARAKEPFEQEGWVYDVDYGGTRAIAELDGKLVKLHSKQLLSFNKKYPLLVATLSASSVHAVVDGEITGSGDDAVFHVFDLLHQDGVSTRELPLKERKQRLKKVRIFGPQVRFAESLDTALSEAIETAKREGARGLVAKAHGSTYHSGTSSDWLKIPFEEKQQAPTFSNLDKVYWPKDGYTKADLIEYYRQVAPVLLPHLKDRPESLHRHPDGIGAPGFFQKDVIGYLPRFASTERIYSESTGRSIDYLLCQNEETLLYLANLGCIELNPWISRVGSLDKPDFSIIDLDPDDPNTFDEVMAVALGLHEILDTIGAEHYLKTSGATGLHICVPTRSFSYDETRDFAVRVCAVLHARFPKNTSLERSPGKRKGKIYLDALQNSRGQTLAAPYCVRPREGAPVSTPLAWNELKPGLTPAKFTIKNIHERIAKKGDLWRGFLDSPGVDLRACLSRLTQEFPMK